MDERNSHVLRNVAWSEMLPWLILFRNFWLSVTSIRMIVMGAAAIFLTGLGWGFFGTVFPTDNPSTQWLEPYAQCSWRAVTSPVPDTPPILSKETTDDLNRLPMQSSPEPYTGSWRLLSRPGWAALDLNLSLKQLLCLTLCGLWSLVVWAYFGGAIARIAAVQLAANERIHWMAALRYSLVHFLSYFGAPLFPLGGAAIAGGFVLSLAWLLNWGVGVFIVGLIWPLMLLLGLVMTLLLVGLFFGWPMMWSTISTEGSDAYDALSRSYAYVYQRPLHYVFYIALAAGLGWLAWLFVENFAAAVIYLTYWAASWATGTERMADIMNSHLDSPLGSAGVAVIHFWTGCVKLLAVGFPFAYLFSASTAIYLLQRRQVDATEMDEVFLEADSSEPEAELPKIVTDAAGAPEIKETAPEREEEKPAAE